MDLRTFETQLTIIFFTVLYLIKIVLLSVKQLHFIVWKGCCNSQRLLWEKDFVINILPFKFTLMTINPQNGQMHHDRQLLIINDKCLIDILLLNISYRHFPNQTIDPFFLMTFGTRQARYTMIDFAIKTATNLIKMIDYWRGRPPVIRATMRGEMVIYF